MKGGLRHGSHHAGQAAGCPGHPARPRAEFARFGGATSCVLVRAGGETILFDAGTGLSGRAWRDFFPEKHGTLLITHAHVDHLMGLPVFPLLFDPTARCDIYLKTREGRTGREQIEALMSPPLWPIRTDSCPMSRFSTS